MSLNYITDEEFATFIAENELVLVDFYADWCGPCKMISPVLEELAEEGYVIAKVDTDSNITVAREYSIVSIPTLLVFRNGEMVKRHTGFAAKAQIKELLK